MRKYFLYSLFLLSTAFGLPALALTDTAKKQLHTEIKTIAAANTNTIVFPALLEEDAQNALAYMEKFSVNRRAYLVRMYTKSKRFFPKVHAILKKYNVPAEFAVLLALESAFNANAVSKAGAVGYWQIMDDVAKEYGLKIVEDQHIAKTRAAAKPQPKTAAGTISKRGVAQKKPQADDRKNFIKSTHTAAKYLKARMKNLDNNWLLIAASYNWGVGNVWNAMASSGKKNPSYWDIQHKMPAETKAYVMNFITLNVIFKNYEKFANGTLDFKAQAPGLSKAEKNNSVATL